MTQPTPQAQPNQAPKIHPERQRRVKQALQLFTFAAWLTGVLFLLLCLRMIMQYGFDMDVSYLSWVARVHGFAFMGFLLASLNLGSKARWSTATWITTAISGVVPFMSFVVEAKRRKEVKETFQLS
ncbi:DUF3817 domain-containing protein [Corynebacterium sp. zg912]|uniref:DUF3817 domain-containing protein n=1 Tax=Corynebacterium wankanglinii TaxID=2735136 RepID=A0A7H0K9Q1_9CORY|nr:MULTISPECIES: DUF3817 domain-containing protein [Corynebacterium]MBA1836228.1 DUF3817 domain-containing protein [Corynebacterium wankanglinii]MBA1837917.1 DUF3817 domain-containing protein [Corynebacterium wankanglinii]MCR5929310.1 DUF3817 domain-containing protein [Corynebacterium sp. zg912]QNP94017.1 DUF3817 domain-containing protein [Corynebacterium wankanglinii]